MIASALPLLVAVPLLSAGLLVIAGQQPRLHKILLFTVLTGALAAAVTMVVTFTDGSALAHGVGLWPSGIAIPLRLTCSPPSCSPSQPSSRSCVPRSLTQHTTVTTGSLPP